MNRSSNKKKKSFHSISYSRQGGQALVLSLGIFLVASVTLFLVFNSGRAVNEKINLVNAADAAAYSGAQIAARQLNFMAYTNRAMIANEVAIGHVFSYQMEMELLGQVAEEAFSGAADNALIQFVLNIIDLFVQGDFSGLVNNGLETIGDFVAILTDATEGLSGVYAMAVDANNAFYSTLQQEAFRDFAYPSDGPPLVNVAMSAVVKDYELRATAPIMLNDPETLSQFIDDENNGVRQAAENALAMQQAFCQMVLFVKPGELAPTGAEDVGTTSQMAEFCGEISSGNASAGGSGSPQAPVDDEGAMLDVLRNTVANFSNAQWIRDRELDYSLIPGLLGINRDGATTVEYENGQINWKSASDEMQVNMRILFGLVTIPLFTASTSGDATSMSETVSDVVDDTLIAYLELYDMCGGDTEVDCATLVTGPYDGVQRYTYLNPAQASPRVTAFLSQQKCGDGIGVDAGGAEVEGWHDNLRFLEEKRQICSGEVFAFSEAEIFFQRPGCEAVANTGSDCGYGFSSTDYSGATFTEKANLFNPFWQVRLVPAQG